MANLAKMLLIVFAIQLGMFMYLGTAGLPGTSMYDFLSNPTDWDNGTLMVLLTGLTVAAITAIAVGTIFAKSDIIIFGAVAATLLSFGFPLARLFSIVASETGSNIPAMLFVSPVILIYVFTVIQWWRGGTQG